MPVEYDATDGIPDDIPGMAVLKKSYDLVCWTRVSFGAEWIMDAEGKFLLNTSPHFHETQGSTDLVPKFQRSIESGLKRWHRIRSHERGSDAEAEEVRLVQEEVAEELRTQRPCIYDNDLATEHTLNTLFSGKPGRFLKKMAGVYAYPDPKVRLQGVSGVGNYAAKHDSEDFRAGGKAFVLARKIAGLLDDPDEDVRRAAAVAVHQFEGREPTASSTAALIEGARELWSAGVEDASSAAQDG